MIIFEDVKTKNDKIWLKNHFSDFSLFINNDLYVLFLLIFCWYKSQISKFHFQVLKIISSLCTISFMFYNISVSSLLTTVRNVFFYYKNNIDEPSSLIWIFIEIHTFTHILMFRHRSLAYPIFLKSRLLYCLIKIFQLGKPKSNVILW